MPKFLRAAARCTRLARLERCAESKIEPWTAVSQLARVSLSTRNLQCIPQPVRGRQPPVLISFTRVDCEVVGNNVCQARRGTQHRLPLRVSHEHHTFRLNGCSRGLTVLFRSPFHVPGKAC